MSDFDDESDVSLYDLSNLELNIDYTSGTADLINDFYIPCLNRATAYDRAAAYFRSSVYHLIGVAMSEFALRGGTMRLVCSPSLEKQDLDMMLKEIKTSADLSQSLTYDVKALLDNPLGSSIVEFLGALLQSGTMEIKIAYRPRSQGIFHMKVGILSDSRGNRVSFSGSENETAMAWDRAMNFESFDVFTSWQGESRESARIVSHIEYFEKLWANQIEDLRVVPLPDVPRRIIEENANRDGVAAAVEKMRHNYNRVALVRTKSSRTPQPHQMEVIQNWWKYRRGIIDHVTGAGKTFTSLCLMREWLNERGSSVLVLVPSNLLADQWDREIRSEMGDLSIRILRIGGPNATPDGFARIGIFTNPINREATAIIATMQSACKKAFLERVEESDKLLVIADEVHKIGSPEYRKILGLQAGGRLGLSATPERYFDHEGSAAIFSYFGETLKPHFGIRDAQQVGRLVEYDYFIHTVSLSEEEHKEYSEFTKKLAVQRGRNNQVDQGNDVGIERILQMRARILKKADRKISAAANIMQKEYSHNAGQRWLVYCDDNEQLEGVSAALNALGIESQTYTSDMLASKKETIAFFERYGGVLLSIHCLDEGVDIPNISHALILSSSVNSREHLQRRGRVLRSTQGKYSAKIHDVLVGRDDDGTFKVFRSEAERAITIAAEARNEIAEVQIRMLLDMCEDDLGIEFEPREPTLTVE